MAAITNYLQTWWLKATEVCLLIILEAGVQDQFLGAEIKVTGLYSFWGL